MIRRCPRARGGFPWPYSGPVPAAFHTNAERDFDRDAAAVGNCTDASSSASPFGRNNHWRRQAHFKRPIITDQFNQGFPSHSLHQLN
ncbi:hypothetical protein BDI4_1040043 [Burkholderia diffusa]|nr:hypothetical protein BDI4_1040043 [Burkholderia diffusa]